MRRASAPVAAAVLAVAAGCGLGTLRDHEEGREFTVGLTTPLSRPETRAEVVRWLENRGGYTVTESRESFVQAEKPAVTAGQVDVLTVVLQVEGDLTRVSINARTFVVTGGGSRVRADQVSGQARGDAGTLAEVLTRLTAPR
jgi:hypothetical protein